MEPEWTKGIKSRTVCDYYYVLFIFNAAACVFALLTGIPALMMLNGTVAYKILNLIFIVGAIALTFFNALFIYLLCDRSLLGEKAGASRQ